MEKNVDSKGRWRNRNVGFRVSEEEAKLLDDLVELSGLAKQDYILRRLLNREVVVQCQTAHCGRCKPHFVFGEFTFPSVPSLNLPQTFGGMTADCRRLV